MDTTYRRQLYVYLSLVIGLLTACHAQNNITQLRLAHHLIGQKGAVVSDTQESTRAGIEILRQGGTAIDAAIAVASTLGVSDPLVSGIGGGGYLLYYDAHKHRVYTIDGREKAGKNASPDMFLNPSGKPLDYQQANMGGLPVGIPGQLALWQLALNHWGKFTLAKDLTPAIAVAKNGYRVSVALHNELIDAASRLQKFSSSAALYFQQGIPLAVDAQKTNPDLAHTYELIAQHGIQEFYQGPIAQDIVQAADHPPLILGQKSTQSNLTVDDFHSYKATIISPIHSTYQGLDIYGMGSSSSGGATVAEILNIVSHFPLSSEPRGLALHQYLEASKLAFADRKQYLGDPAYSHSSIGQIISPEFAAQRAALISAHYVLSTPQRAGSLVLGQSEVKSNSPIQSTFPSHEGTHTNHFVVSDQDGNIVSYTNTINFYGGSGITVPGRGFLLNDELTDFDFSPEVAHDPNLPAAGKRPLSAMSPTIVLSKGIPWLALGSPGGPTIITTIAQTLLNRIDFHMSLAEAVAAPRASERNARAIQIEPAFEHVSQFHYLQQLGHKFYSEASKDQNPGVHTIPTIGEVAALEFKGPNIIAVGEPVRRGGTWAATVE